MSRARDPFNFDDIYKKAGVEDLFVKKTMGEMKKPSTPVPFVNKSSSQTSLQSLNESSIAKPTVPVQARIQDSMLESLGKDLNAKDSSKANSTSMGLEDLFINASQPIQQSTQSAPSDPFFMFDNVDGLLPQVVTRQVENPYETSAGMPDMSAGAFETDAGLSLNILTPSDYQPKITPLPKQDSLNLDILASSDPQPKSSAVKQDDIPLDILAPSNPSLQKPVIPKTETSQIAPPQEVPLVPSRPPLDSHAPVSVTRGDSLHSRAPNSNEGSHRWDEPKSYVETSRTPVPQEPHRDRQIISNTKTAFTGFMKKVITGARTRLQQLEQALERLDGPEHTYPGYQASQNPPPPSYPEPATAANSHPPAPMYHPPAERQERLDAEVALTTAIELAELPRDEQRLALAELPEDLRGLVWSILDEHEMARKAAALDRSSQSSRTADAKEAGDEHESRTSPSYAHLLFPGGNGLRSEPEPKAHVVAAEGDLLGIDGPTSARSEAPKPNVKQGGPTLGDLEHSSQPVVEPSPSSISAVPKIEEMASVDDMDGFFSGGTPAVVPSTAAPASVPAPPASRNSSSKASAAMPTPSGSGPRSAPRAAPGPKQGDHMIRMHEQDDLVDDDTSVYSTVFHDDQGNEDEPEIRKALRAARLAERAAKMADALDEVRAKDAELERQQEEAQHQKARKMEGINTWKNRNKGNIRGLLGSLQTVLWEDSGWKPISVGDLLEPNQVKKAYMKANLVVHPDKVRQRNGTAEQVAIADLVFDVLKEAWGQFST